ncbi:MAG: hypothetical protein LBI53_04290 [Candidatus Peribacteria bacterium]|nr:hypothetical protein [Candidatus Peribacteria bacterium]
MYDLDLSNNQIYNIQSGAFENLYFLTNLDIDNNCLGAEDIEEGSSDYFYTRFGSGWEANQKLCIKGVSYTPIG